MSSILKALSKASNVIEETYLYLPGILGGKGFRQS